MSDLFRGYKSFLISLFKAMRLERQIIESEVDFFTRGYLKDGFLFFIIATQKMDTNTLGEHSIVDYEILKEYIKIPRKEDGLIKLSDKGDLLFEYLEEKLEKHAAILQFNGLKAQDIAKAATSLKRFEQFWQWLLDARKI